MEQMKNYNLKDLKNSKVHEIYFEFINEITENKLFSNDLFNLSINKNYCMLLININVLNEKYKLKENLILKTNYFFDTNDFEIKELKELNYYLILFEF